MTPYFPTRRSYDLLGLYGAGPRPQQAGGDGALPDRRTAHGRSEGRCAVPSLPARAPRRGSGRRGDRRPALARLGRGREPRPCAGVDPALGAGEIVSGAIETWFDQPLLVTIGERNGRGRFVRLGPGRTSIRAGPCMQPKE